MSSSASQLRVCKKSEKRENLVVVRAGTQSKHKSWFSQAENRNWDLCIAAYEKISDEDLQNAEFIIEGGLSKWTVLADHFYSNDVFSDYEYFFILDDDITFNHASNINTLFELSKKLELSVSQASLSPNSFASWRVTQNQPGSVLRYTNFVECMAPIFSNLAIKKLQPYISKAISGVGLDVIFWDALGRPANSMAVIDLIQMHHTMPVDKNGGAFYQHLTKNGINVEDELAFFMGLFDLTEFEIQTLGLVTRKEKITIPNL